MYVKQISVFIENAPGKLADFTRILGEKGIDLLSLSIADTTSFGILRGIVADWEKASKLIEEAGYTVCLTDVLAVEVPDRPGGLAGILTMLSEKGIEIEYLYSFVRNKSDKALIVFRVPDTDKAQAILSEHRVRCLSQEEIASF
ncbi:MAG: ACT domain-containing protein [Clostridia bacterium]|nr:ACT domain-containing protein [Clostridia bacterium]